MIWNNKDNENYYNNIPIEILKKYCIEGGFNNREDIRIIFDILKDSKNLLDAGCGYGRSIIDLLNLGFKNKITGVEISKNLYKESLKIESNKISIINCDLLRYNPKEKHDFVILMWGVFCDFNKDEQYKLLKHLKNIISHDGTIIIDSLNNVEPKNFNSKTDKKSLGIYYSGYSDFGKINGYIPKHQEISDVCSIMNFSLKTIPYKTKSGRKRIFYILKNIE